MLEVHVAEHLKDKDIKNIFNIEFNGDRIEALKLALEKYTLDPTFSKYGDFVNRNPQWLNKDTQDKYKNCAMIFGNFYTCSFGFRITTDEEKIINEIEELVIENKNTEGYKQAEKDIFLDKIKQKLDHTLRYYKNSNNYNYVINYMKEKNYLKDAHEVAMYNIYDYIRKFNDDELMIVGKIILSK